MHGSGGNRVQIERLTMQYKQLADTGVQVPEIGLGAWQYKGGAEPLRKGVALGANLVDTAEAYGTEDVVGAAVKGIREQVFIATKVSPSHFRREALLKSADMSLERLGVDVIDLYQLHWPSQSIPIEETMGAMDELVDMGKIRYIGVSNFSVAQFRSAQAATKYKIVSIQVKYSLADRGIEGELIPFCREQNVTVIAYSPLARDPAGLDARLSGALSKIAADTGRTIAQIALNWCISRDHVIAIPKSDSVERTEENCLASGWRLSPEHIQLLEQSS